MCSSFISYSVDCSGQIIWLEERKEGKLSLERPNERSLSMDNNSVEYSVVVNSSTRSRYSSAFLDHIP